jgi:cell filamentation protein
MASITKNKAQFFEGAQVRAVWDEEAGKWWFSVIDVIGILTDQPDYEKARNYWKWLKGKLKEEGSQLVSNTNQLKLLAPDGKEYLFIITIYKSILNNMPVHCLFKLYFI